MMEKVKEIIARVFKIDVGSVTAEMTPDDVEVWDSLGQLTLINALEKEFDVVFETEEIFEIMKIGDIFDILERKKVA